MPLLREARSHLKPPDRVSHTNLYSTHREKIATAQTRVSSERVFSTETPTAEQASQTHGTTASQRRDGTLVRPSP